MPVYNHGAWLLFNILRVYREKVTHMNARLCLRNCQAMRYRGRNKGSEIPGLE